jgi:hypothetical protein
VSKSLGVIAIVLVKPVGIETETMRAAIDNVLTTADLATTVTDAITTVDVPEVQEGEASMDRLAEVPGAPSKRPSAPWLSAAAPRSLSALTLIPRQDRHFDL